MKKTQHKKRTKADASSRAASPASSAAASPLLPSHAGSPPLHPPPLPRQGAAPGPHTSKPPPLLPASATNPTPIAPAPPSSSKKASSSGAPTTLKARKEALVAQLPLRPGRPIAVKEAKKPPGPGQGGAGAVGGAAGAGGAVGPAGALDNYILGRVVMCLQGDKNRCGLGGSLSLSLRGA